MKIVVIAPYRSATMPEQALAQCAQYMGELLRRGHDPYNSAVFAVAMGLRDSDARDRERGTRWGLEKIRDCQRAIVVGTPGGGMLAEIKEAEQHRLRIDRYDGWREAWDALRTDQHRQASHYDYCR